jgi:hypothetical protein
MIRSKALGDCQMLNTQLLDCLLQRSAPPPNEETRFQVDLGSLGTRAYMESCNALVNVDRGSLAPSNWNRIQAKIKGIQSSFDHLFSHVIDDDATKRVIILIVNALYFFVLVVEFNVECPELFLRFEYYDSLRRSSRGGPRIMQGTPGAWLIVCEVRAFFFNFVLQDKNKFNYITSPTDDDLLNHMIVGFRQCPGQYNGINCGLFCIAVVLHLLDGKPMTEGTFNFNHCILLRSKLAAHFNRDNGAYEQTSQVVRDCFPQLKGRGCCRCSSS